MKRDSRFSYWTSTKAALMLLALEALMLWLMGLTEYAPARASILLGIAGVMTLTFVILSTEVVTEVKDTLEMFIFLFLTIIGLVIFFAFQYAMLQYIAPGSFTGLTLNPVDALYNSTMIFVFNPLMVANTTSAKLLVLENVFGSIAVVIFVFQNVWQLRKQ